MTSNFPLWAPPLVALAVSFVTCLGGVSGAFLLVPLQMALIGTAPSISATTHVYNLFATPGGIVSYGRERRIVWPLVVVLVAGTLPGVFIGAWIRITYLHQPTPFKLFVAVVLAWVGTRLALDLADRRRSANRAAEGEAALRRRIMDRHGTGLPAVAGTRLDWREVRFSFCGFEYAVPVVPVFALSALVGVVGGVYGVGGGSIIAPVLISMFGLPVYTVAGAALLSTFVTSAAGAASFQVLAAFNLGVSCGPDWQLGLLLGLGGFTGMYLAGHAQKYLSGALIRALLAAITLLSALNYALDALRSILT